MPKFDVLMLLSLTHVIANRLNSKYLRHAGMADWLTYLTKNVGSPVRVSLPPPPSSLNFPPLDVSLGVFLICCSQRVEDKRITGYSQFYLAQENNRVFTVLFSISSLS